LPVSIVQTVAASANGVGSITVTISPTTAGNLLLVAVEVSNTTIGISISATSQTFTLIANPSFTNAGQIGAWYVANCAAGTTGITIQRVSGTGQFSVIVRELANEDPSAPLDQSVGQGGTLGDSGTTGTTTQADEFWWAVFGALSPQNGSLVGFSGISSPWTDGAESLANATGSNANSGIHDGYQIVSATGVAHATITMSNTLSSAGCGVAATFKAAVAAAPQVAMAQRVGGIRVSG
jgi:hypothetical protein